MFKEHWVKISCLLDCIHLKLISRLSVADPRGGGGGGGAGVGGGAVPHDLVIYWVRNSAQYAVHCMRKPLEIKNFPGGGPLDPFSIFQYRIIINISVSSFCFIWIPILWVYGHWKYFNSFGAGTVFIRQNMTSTDVRFWRIKTVPALKRLPYLSCL